MFGIDVLQNQWLILSLGAGLALVLAVALYYLAMWRPRPGEPAAPGSGRATGFFPRLLALVYAFVLVFALIYTWFMIRHPPNW
jgi:hypothetical protein